MNIDRILVATGEAIGRCMKETAPWLIGFAYVYFAGHVIVAMLKGWL